MADSQPASWGDADDDPVLAAWAARGQLADRANFDRARSGFEARAVRHVLAGMGMATTEAMLARAARDRTGDPDLTFALLRHLMPSFPIVLGVARLFYLAENFTLEAIFRRPAATQPVKAFAAWLEDEPLADPLPRGLIFRLPGCPGKGERAILHTYPAPADDRLARVSFGVEDRPGNVVHYTLEPLDQLLVSLRRTFRPDHGHP